MALASASSSRDSCRRRAICQPGPTPSLIFPTTQTVLGPVGRALGVPQTTGKALTVLTP
jgi:hypothetical protein